MKQKTSWEDSWAYYHWLSADILSPSEINAARRELDELTFMQEYGGSFVNFTGQAYYSFDSILNTLTVEYAPKERLIFCFDFNVEPGTATVIQEKDCGTCVIDEVYIPRNSNTIRVCRKLLSMYGEHSGEVWCYGDATGGARGSAQVRGSDWDLIKEMLLPVFGDRLWIRTPKANPRERTRINAVNSRCKTMSGDRHLFVDPKCKKTIADFEGTILLEGGSGEIDKSDDSTKTHLTDGIGYYIVKRWPLRKVALDTTPEVHRT